MSDQVVRWFPDSDEDVPGEWQVVNTVTSTGTRCAATKAAVDRGELCAWCGDDMPWDEWSQSRSGYGQFCSTICSGEFAAAARRQGR